MVQSYGLNPSNLSLSLYFSFSFPCFNPAFKVWKAVILGEETPIYYKHSKHLDHPIKNNSWGFDLARWGEAWRYLLWNIKAIWGVSFEKISVKTVNNLRNNPTNKDVPKLIEVMWNWKGVIHMTCPSIYSIYHGGQQNHQDHQLHHPSSKPLQIQTLLCPLCPGWRLPATVHPLNGNALALFLPANTWSEKSWGCSYTSLKADWFKPVLKDGTDSSICLSLAPNFINTGESIYHLFQTCLWILTLPWLQGQKVQWGGELQRAIITTAEYEPWVETLVTNTYNGMIWQQHTEILYVFKCKTWVPYFFQICPMLFFWGMP